MLSFSFYLKIFIKFVPDFAYLDVFATYLKCKSLKLNKLHIHKDNGLNRHKKRFT